ncbi:PLP-dependent aminotransferase family protein [Arthrobacter agilis]|uniref:MocR-like transcription factor YczR n=1 Tax=Arthrobacter agilis TaxID=37921 RepID=UPI000B34EE4E|nr:PLP-dependent aminotransferase family protein [Arthrobacter agilis]OUM42961.1 GntR family transcriptional regulator [Arthrobacter agilis]PPB45907.1 PLP-dependent aminotransferase family protein [Arthrobacter agilis]TPV25449.1 PLP-dependent aminotransferase family protein [Arthrobacter agilis]VDR33189.1 2-aminoadipate transaminase [Arthrobacter agilis]
MMILPARRLAADLGSWRTSGPAYAALADRIRLLTLDGRIPLGTRLPAERELAAHLAVSRTLVAAAYGRLRDAGYVESTRGSGSVVAMPGRGTPEHDDGGAAVVLDLSKAALPAAPQVGEAAARAALHLPAYLNGDGYDLLGLPRLRRALADRYTARGVATSPEQVMVTLGAQHAISLLARTLLTRSDTVLVEAPSYPHAYEALRSAARRLVPVSVDASEGWDEDGLHQAIARANPALAYLMPDFHNPTGAVMPAVQRERLMAAAVRQGTIVVADETMAELRIEGGTELPLAAFGPAVLIGSMGKTVWGGLRIGWIRAEPELIQRLHQARYGQDLGTPILEQLIALEMLGDYDALLRFRAQQLADGQKALAQLLANTFPAWEVPKVAGGLSTWVNLGAPRSSDLALAARDRGLLLGAGPRFGLNGVFERFLRIPFSYPAEDTRRAVAILSEAWLSLGDHVPACDDFAPALV